MRLGRAPVVTGRPGVDDYVTDGRSGLLVPPYDVAAMGEALARMWDDAELRARLDTGAAAFAEANCTDAAAGAALGRILDEVEAERGSGR